MNAEIRVYPDKELKAVDMAEIVDSLQLADGIIQGCGVEITQNGTALHIDDGRILIHGRLGVVTAGNVELPALEATATCHLTAVCDLAIENPFYISLLTGADLSALEQKKSRVTHFNVGNGVDYVILGTAVVNPTTHIVSDWTPLDADPVSNKITFGDLQQDVDDLKNALGNTAMGTTANTVTGAVKELVDKDAVINQQLNSVNSSIRTLEGKGGGIVGSKSINVAQAGKQYVQLAPSSSYLVLVGANALDNALRGAYLVGVNADKHIGVKAIATAASVEVIDAGSVAGNYTGVMRITNNGGTTLRVTIITLFGTAA